MIVVAALVAFTPTSHNGLQASYPLSSVRMLTNSALFSLTLSESDYDNRVRTSCGVAQLMLADRASNPDEP